MGNIFSETLDKWSKATSDLGEHLATCSECNEDAGRFCDAWRNLLQTAIHQPKYPSGVEVINANACPLKNNFTLACCVCNWGHFTECHAPYTCADAHCDHYCTRPTAAIAQQIINTNRGTN